MRTRSGKITKAPADQLKDLHQKVKDALKDTLTNAIVNEADKIAYAEFMTLKVFSKDFSVASLKLAPTGRIDSVWHQHILVPHKYAAFCDRVGGRMIEHDPSTASTALAEREEATRALRKQFADAFDTDLTGAWDYAHPKQATLITLPDISSDDEDSDELSFRIEPAAASKPSPPQRAVVSSVQTDTRAPHLFVKMLTGQTLEIPIAIRHQRVKDLQDRIRALTGIPPDQQRLVYQGWQLDENEHMSKFGFVGGEHVHLVLRMRGC